MHEHNVARRCTCPQVLYIGQSAVLTEVMDYGGVALGGVVGVPYVTERHMRGHGVPGHTGHCHRGDTTRRVELKHILTLRLLQQEHHGLEERREEQRERRDTSRTESKPDREQASKK